MSELSRRNFLKSMGVFSAGMAGAPLKSFQEPDPPVEEAAPVGYAITHWDGSPLGRIMLDYMTVYTEPHWRSGSAGLAYYYDDIIPIEQAVGGEGLYSSNHTWLKTADGYIYSSWVQPINHIEGHATAAVPEGGLWIQVTVPKTWQRGEPHDDSWRHRPLYYSTINRVLGVENDYYLVEEIYGNKYWVKASHCRVIPPEEVAPINAHVPAHDKHIYVSIGDQRLRCYEGDALVAEFQTSTGKPGTSTSFGEFYVRDKRIGQRMTGGLGAGAYNLPGIPYIAYFTPSWIATHGTYWHNDFGRLHSNGCVNLHPNDAKWVFRWTTPYANYWAFNTKPSAENPGTVIKVGY